MKILNGLLKMVNIPKILEIRFQINHKLEYVNGLAVYGANIGMLMEIEASSKKIKIEKVSLKLQELLKKKKLQ